MKLKTKVNAKALDMSEKYNISKFSKNSEKSSFFARDYEGTNYRYSDNPFPTYVFQPDLLALEQRGNKDIDMYMEDIIEKTQLMIDDANDDLKDIANRLASKFEVKRNSAELDLARDLYTIALKDGYNSGFSMILEFDDLFIDEITPEQRQYLENNIRSNAEMMMKNIAKKNGFVLATKSQDKYIEDNEIKNLYRTKELFTEDRLMNNVPDYSLNEFFGTIQIGLKDIESKSLRVTRNPNMKYVVYDGEKEIAYLDNSKGTVFYEDSLDIFSRFTFLRRDSKKNPVLKEKIKNALENPNMNFFPIEEVGFTAEENREAFRTSRGKTASLIVKYYESIYKDTLISINYNGSSIPINFNGKDDENDLNRILKNDFHGLYNKYGVTLAKFALNGELANQDDLIDFKASLLQILNTETEDTANKILSELNVQQILDKYGLSLATEQDAMVNRIFAMERKSSNYKIVQIKSFSESTYYAKFFKEEYVKAQRNRPAGWCITDNKQMFEVYVDPKDKTKGEVYYYLLREPDWNTKFTISDDESKRSPFDNYGSSMIAISIKQNGMIYKATSRYNHGLPRSTYSDTDKVFTEEDVSKLLGRPIFEALPPLNPVNTPVSGDNQSKLVLQKGIPLLKASEGDRKIIQYQDGYYLFMENSILKDRKTKKLFKFTNIKKIKNKDGLIGGYLFYYSIKQANEVDFNFIMGLDKDLKMIIPSKQIISSDPLLEKNMAKTIVNQISDDEEEE
jgi:hypothetical protein